MGTNENRRKSNRVPYPDSCKLTLIENNEDISYHAVEVRNLSLGGLAVESDKPYSCGKVVAVTFGNTEDGFTVVNGEIQHCMENQNGHFIIGIRFEPVQG